MRSKLLRKFTLHCQRPTWVNIQVTLGKFEVAQIEEGPEVEGNTELILLVEASSIGAEVVRYCKSVLNLPAPIH